MGRPPSAVTTSLPAGSPVTPQTVPGSRPRVASRSSAKICTGWQAAVRAPTAAAGASRPGPSTPAVWTTTCSAANAPSAARAVTSEGSSSSGTVSSTREAPLVASVESAMVRPAAATRSRPRSERAPTVTSTPIRSRKMARAMPTRPGPITAAGESLLLGDGGMELPGPDVTEYIRSNQNEIPCAGQSGAGSGRSTGRPRARPPAAPPRQGGQLGPAQVVVPGLGEHPDAVGGHQRQARLVELLLGLGEGHRLRDRKS